MIKITCFVAILCARSFPAAMASFIGELPTTIAVATSLRFSFLVLDSCRMTSDAAAAMRKWRMGPHCDLPGTRPGGAGAILATPVGCAVFKEF